MKLTLALLLALSLSANAQNKKKQMFMALLSGSSEVADPNIALGDAFLTISATTRAYWDFTTLSGADGTVLSSHEDLSISGTWDLDDGSGVNNPKSGIIQRGTSSVACLRAKTASTYKEAFKTTTAATNLLKNDVEVHFLISFEDGRNASNNTFFGSDNGGTQLFRLRVNSAGNITLEYAASGAGLSTLTSSGATFPDGLTGVHLLRIRCDFTTDVISGMLDGIPLTFSLTSGNAVSTWNASTWTSGSRGCGIGGDWSGSFSADTSNLKYILKCAVTDLLTDDQYLQLASSFLNY